MRQDKTKQNTVRQDKDKDKTPVLSWSSCVLCCLVFLWCLVFVFLLSCLSLESLCCDVVMPCVILSLSCLVALLSCIALPCWCLILCVVLSRVVSCICKYIVNTLSMLSCIAMSYMIIMFPNIFRCIPSLSRS
jgi:hypothetical protein